MSRLPAVVLGLGFVVWAGSSPALAMPVHMLEAHVPFSFRVGSVSLPPGVYVIERADATDPHQLLIRLKDGRHPALFFVETLSWESDSVGSPRLEFERIGDTAWLHTIAVPGEGDEVVYASSAAEARAARNLGEPAESGTESSVGSR